MAEKVTKPSVNYRKAAPAARKHCGNCVMFRNGLCTLVKGKIEPEYVCDRWAKK